MKPWLYGGCWSHQWSRTHTNTHTEQYLSFTVNERHGGCLSVRLMALHGPPCSRCVCVPILLWCISVLLCFWKLLKVAMRAVWVIFCILAFIFCLRSASNKHIPPTKFLKRVKIWRDGVAGFQHKMILMGYIRELHQNPDTVTFLVFAVTIQGARIRCGNRLLIWTFFSVQRRCGSFLHNTEPLEIPTVGEKRWCQRHVHHFLLTIPQCNASPFMATSHWNRWCKMIHKRMKSYTNRERSGEWVTSGVVLDRAPVCCVPMRVVDH